MILSIRMLVLCSLLAMLPVGPAGADDDGALLLATTTSVRDTGLLDVLLPMFQKEAGIKVKPIAVGTGAALRMGAEGNVDVLLTHAPEAEKELIRSAALVKRQPFMENFFVIVGPPKDPAGVHEAETATEAFRGIAASEAPYVSRGDDSGTHKRERALLRAAGLDPAGGWKGFSQTGSGMGLTLQVADERHSYTLSDIGTYLAYEERIEIQSLSKPDPELRNVYSVLRVNPARFGKKVDANGAERFAAFLVREDTQAVIGAFGVERFGRPLFTPLFKGADRPLEE
jgi:tungstate transport system substrate-binding protein